MAIVAAPAKDVAVRWPREHCGALRDTAQRDCARPAPPSVGLRPPRGADNRWQASAASQVALGGLRLAEFADSPLREARQARKARDQPACGELRVCGVSLVRRILLFVETTILLDRFWLFAGVVVEV
jgi:hypothetical protein